MKREKQEIEEQLESLKKHEKELEMKVLKIANHKDNQIKSLKFLAKTNVQMQSTYFSKVEEFSNVHPVAPLVLKASFEIKMSFQSHRGWSSGNHYTTKPYHSQSFNSHQSGYKLQLSAEVLCPCSDCRKPQKVATQHQLIGSCTYDEWMQGDKYYDFGHMQQQQFYNSDVSDCVPSYPTGYASLAVNLYILKGDNNSQLKWPFQEKITVTMYQEDEYGYRSAVANDGFTDSRL